LGAEAGFGFMAYTIYDLGERSAVLNLANASEAIIGGLAGAAAIILVSWAFSNE
jgi:hypothetical protein